MLYPVCTIIGDHRDPLKDMRDHLRDQERDIMADRLDSERLRGFCD